MVHRERDAPGTGRDLPAEAPLVRREVPGQFVGGRIRPGEAEGHRLGIVDPVERCLRELGEVAVTHGRHRQPRSLDRESEQRPDVFKFHASTLVAGSGAPA